MITQELQGGNIAYADVKLASKLDAAGGAAAAVTITKTTGGRLIAHKVYWSYDTTPTGGSISITGGPAEFKLDIPAAGPGSITLGPYICSVTTDLVVTLAAGGGSVAAKLNFDYSLRMYA